jgi:2-dehydropantoate 2-reductase
MDDLTFGIIGVGPIGSIMAAHLRKAGHSVTLVDILKDHLDEIKKKGLILTGFKELKATFPPTSFCYSIKEMDKKKIDVVFISIKASILPRILPELKKVTKPGTLFISLQNGLDAENLIADSFGAKNTLRIVINYAGNIIANGKVRMSFFNAPNYIGMIDASAKEKAKQLADIITRSDLKTSFTSEIKKYEWEKTILNTALSPVCALTRRTMKQMMEFSKSRELVKAILCEGLEVAEANGIFFEPDFLKHGIEYLDKAGHHKTSMHVDIERGSPTEIGFINGKIVEYGKRKGIPTPYNSTIVALIMGAELPEFKK